MSSYKHYMAMGLGVSALAIALIACSPAPTTATTEAPMSAEVAEAADTTAPTSLEALSKDLSIQQVNVASVPSAPPLSARDLRVEAKVDKSTYKIGEDVVLTARPNKDAYIWVVNVHDDGKMEMLFPNKFNSDNFVGANKEITLPPAGSSYTYTVGGKPGADLVQVFATMTPEAPLPALSPSTDAFSKGIGTLSTDAEALSKDLNIVVQRVNCAVSKDLSIVASTQPTPAAGSKPTAQPIDFEELCGAPGAVPATSVTNEKPIQIKADWRNMGFASTSAVFKIEK